MNDWINQKKSKRLIIHIIDSRHEPLESDINLQKWLKKNNIQYLLVPNKIDNLKTQQLRKQTDLFRFVFRIEHENIIPFSATEGTGKIILWRRINQLLFSNPNQ